MIIDLDQWIHEEESADLGERVFPHDIFLSHRRFDLPHAWVESLSESGVRTVWDCDLELRDRRVMHAIARAMRRSRYVALFVSDFYVDSPWCRAEYLSALTVEEKYKVPRALVIAQSEVAAERVPIELRHQQQYLATQTGATALAALVSRGNRTGLDPRLEAAIRQVPSDILSPRVDLLTIEEHLNILEQRLAYWVQSEEPVINVSSQARAAHELMNTIGEPYSEIEDIIREVRNLVLERGPAFKPRVGIGETELRRVASIAALVVASYSKPSKFAAARVSESWLYDFLLKPLLLAVSHENTRESAVVSYRKLCEEMVSGSEAEKISVYLGVLEAVTLGDRDIESLVRQATVSLLQDR